MQTPVTSCNILILILVTLILRSSLPLDKELHSIWEILMLKDRSKDAPEVTTVRTMGLLLSSPMSMYTEIRKSERRGDVMRRGLL